MERLVSDVVRKAALPVLERLGAVGALWFISTGVDPSLVDQTVVALVAGGGLLIDLLVSTGFKKWKKRNAVRSINQHT